eukprot:TRINITY_DN6840_c0_g1_i2.p1 TRINITY_DN6840_c0_g1~~TRINITY_DN6840_c0_g1_i2.p1  ORF type:complete len:224 (+),score=47.44 TRINITY_DN6840_c0_g1_i2:1-672(+)
MAEREWSAAEWKKWEEDQWEKQDGYDGYDGYDDFGAQGARGGGSSSQSTWYQGHGRHHRKQDQVKTSEIDLAAFHGGKVAGLVAISGENAKVYRASQKGVLLLRTIRPKGIGHVTASASRRGGQSAPRFQRAADQGRAAWVRRVSEEAGALLLSPEVAAQAVCVCGSAELRRMLVQSWEDPRLEGCLEEMDQAPAVDNEVYHCLLYTSPSPRDRTRSRMPSSA